MTPVPKRNDLTLITLHLACPAGHTLGRLRIDRDLDTLTLITAPADRENPGQLRYESGKLRYLCPSCINAGHARHAPYPQPRAVPWRSVAALAAALACSPTDNLNRTLTATAEHVRDALRAIVPDDEARPAPFAEYLAAFRHGPNYPRRRDEVTDHAGPGI